MDRLGTGRCNATPRSVLIVVATLATVLGPRTIGAAPSLGLPVTLVTEAPSAGAFPLVTDRGAAPFCYDANDHTGVLRALGDLGADIERVTGHARPCPRPAARTRSPSSSARWARARRSTRWWPRASWMRATSAGSGRASSSPRCPTPCRASSRALVIAGSDKRGTIYGIYELSEQLGVSPWYWWADVPVKKRARAYVRSRAIRFGRAGGPLPRHLPERRGAVPDRLDQGEVRRDQLEVLHEGLRAAAAPARQLPLAGDVGQRLQ